MVRETQPDDIGVSVSYPLPGTKFLSTGFCATRQESELADSGDLAMMFQGAYSTEFYRALARCICIWKCGNRKRRRDRRAHGPRVDALKRPSAARVEVASMKLLLTHGYFLCEDPKSSRS